MSNSIIAYYYDIQNLGRKKKKGRKEKKAKVEKEMFIMRSKLS